MISTLQLLQNWWGESGQPVHLRSILGLCGVLHWHYHTHTRHPSAKTPRPSKVKEPEILILILVKGGLHNTQRYPVSRVCGAIDLHRRRYWTCCAWDLHCYYWPPHGWLHDLEIRPQKPWPRVRSRSEILWPIARGRLHLGSRESEGFLLPLLACHCPWGPSLGCFVLGACAGP